MSGDNYLARDASSPDDLRDVEEVLEIAPGVLWVSNGRFVQAVNQQSPEQAAEFRAAMRRSIPRLAYDLQATVAKIRAAISGVPAHQLLSLLALDAFFRTAERPGASGEPDCYPIVVEYATWLVATSPRLRLQGALDLKSYARIRRLIDAAIDLVYWRSSMDHLTQTDEPGALDRLRLYTRLHSLLVRNPTYVAHLEDQQRALLEPFGQDLKQVAGFDVQELLSAIAATEKRIEAGINDLAERCWRLAKRSLGRFRETPKSKLRSWERAALRNLREAQDPERAAAESLANFLFLQELPAVFRIDANQLAGAASLSLETTARILETFSLSVGQPAIGDSAPSLYDPLEHRPLLDLGDGSYLMHLSVKWPWAARTRLESLMKTGTRVWARYQKRRGAYLEDRLVALLATVSPHAKSWRRLRYTLDDGTECELDGIVACDTALFLIEAKAGQVGSDVWCGAPKSTVADLQDLVGSAHQQALRAVKFIVSRPKATFVSERGDVVVIDQSAFRRVYLIAGTLEPLGLFAAKSSLLADIGVIQRFGLPWVVSEFDLRVIVDQVEGMGQLVHYLSRRLRVESQNVHAWDELDWFGRYLREGLHFTEFPQGGRSNLVVSGYSNLFEECYQPRPGSAPTPKVRQEMPVALRELIHVLERRGPDGFVEVIQLLLDAGAVDRQELAEMIASRRERGLDVALALGRMRSGRRLFCYLVIGRNGLEAPYLDRLLLDVTCAAKYNARAEEAVGVLQEVHQLDDVRVCVQAYPWVEDASTAATAVEVLSACGATSVWPTSGVEPPTS